MYHWEGEQQENGKFLKCKFKKKKEKKKGRRFDKKKQKRRPCSIYIFRATF